MNAKHSPAPWQWDGHGVLRDANQRAICCLASPPTAGMDPADPAPYSQQIRQELQAAFALLESAPELLEACRRMHARITRMSDIGSQLARDWLTSFEFDNITAAIAKAERTAT